MSFSAYDSDAIRVLSAALFDALKIVRESVDGSQTEDQMTDFTKRLTDNLMMAFDRGQRDPEALQRAALNGVIFRAS